MLFDLIHFENLGVQDLKLDTKQCDACNTCPQKKKRRGSEAGISHEVIQNTATN